MEEEVNRGQVIHFYERAMGYLVWQHILLKIDKL